MLLDSGGAGLWFDYIRLFGPHEHYQDKNLPDFAGAFEDPVILWETEVSVPPVDLAADARLIARCAVSRSTTVRDSAVPGLVRPTQPPGRRALRFPEARPCSGMLVLVEDSTQTSVSSYGQAVDLVWLSDW
jgi:hypothetical protein